MSCDDFVELREPFEPQDDHERFIKLGALLGAAETRRFMKGEVQILGDIISPASDPDDWEVMRD